MRRQKHKTLINMFNCVCVCEFLLHFIFHLNLIYILWIKYTKYLTTLLIKHWSSHEYYLKTMCVHRCKSTFLLLYVIKRTLKRLLFIIIKEQWLIIIYNKNNSGFNDKSRSLVCYLVFSSDAGDRLALIKCISLIKINPVLHNLAPYY